MTKDGTMQKATIHTILAVLTIAIGAVLLVYMVTVESEPGAIPLLLLVAGTAWLFLTRAKIRSHQK